MPRGKWMLYLDDNDGPWSQNGFKESKRSGCFFHFKIELYWNISTLREPLRHYILFNPYFTYLSFEQLTFYATLYFPVNHISGGNFYFIKFLRQTQLQVTSQIKVSNKHMWKAYEIR